MDGRRRKCRASGHTRKNIEVSLAANKADQMHKRHILSRQSYALLSAHNKTVPYHLNVIKSDDLGPSSIIYRCVDVSIHNKPHSKGTDELWALEASQIRQVMLLDYAHIARNQTQQR